MDRERRYVYKPLSCPRSTRLIHYWRGIQAVAVEAYRIDDAPSYDALSYTWDGQGRDCELHTSTGLLLVTRNCYLALQELRGASGAIGRIGSSSDADGGLIWIDALCINQDDIAEKDQQLQLMSDIYSHARKTVVFISQELDDRDFYFNLSVGVEARSFQINNIDIAIRRDPANHMGTEESHKKVVQEYDHRVYRLGDTLEGILGHSWFSRVWIIQEVLLATDVQIITLNGRSLSLPWNMIDKATRQLAEGQGFKRKSVVSRALELMDMRKEFAQSRSIGLASALRLAHNSAATDPRDKIFGLLGICNSLRENIDATYTKSVGEVWQNATATMLSAHGLRAFNYLTTAGCLEDANFPSWVADFGRLTPASRGWINWPESTAEHGTETYRLDGQRLQVSGAIVDRILYVYDLNMNQNTRMASQVWYNWLEFAGGDKSINTVYPGSENRWRLDLTTAEPMQVVFWRTMFQDTQRRIRDCDDLTRWHEWFCAEAGTNILYWDSVLLNGRDSEPCVISRTTDYGEMTVTLAQLRLFTAQKKMCWTRGVKLGIAPDEVREGDLVAVLAGYASPVVVRPGIADGAYRLICPVYIHGMMDGEAHPAFQGDYRPLILE